LSSNFENPFNTLNSNTRRLSQTFQSDFKSHQMSGAITLESESHFRIEKLNNMTKGIKAVTFEKIYNLTKC